MGAKQHGTKRQWVNEDVREEKKKKKDTWRQMKTKWKHNGLKSLGHSKTVSKNEVYGDSGLPQVNKQTNKTKQNNLTLHLMEQEKENKQRLMLPKKGSNKD